MKSSANLVFRAAIASLLVVMPCGIPVAIHINWARDFAEKSTKARNPVVRETTTGPLEFDRRLLIPLMWPGDEMAEAIVASEDSRFFEREGAFDAIAVGAALYGLLTGDGMRGSSSIPMQLARVEHPYVKTPEGVGRKLTNKWCVLGTRKALEVLLGDRALAERGHTGVLAAYCSLVPTPGTGVESATIREFGVLAEDVSSEQAVAVSALLPAPGRRTLNRIEWQEATSRRLPGAMVSPAPLLQTGYPLGALLTHPDAVLDIETTRRAFLVGHRLAATDDDIVDVGIIVLRGLEPVALVDTSRPGVRKPWPWAAFGSIRMNSTKKIFDASVALKSSWETKSLGYALEHSNRPYFIHLNEAFGRGIIEHCFNENGLIHREGYSYLGRCWVSPMDLARAARRCVSSNPQLQRLLREVPRRGTAASALRTWPGLPQTAWCKTGTSPQGKELLLVGGDNDYTILIWALTKTTTREAGAVLGPPFAHVLQQILTRPPEKCSRTPMLSSN